MDYLRINTNLSYGDHKSKIRISAEPCFLQGSRVEYVPWFFQLLVADSIPSFMTLSLQWNVFLSFSYKDTDDGIHGPYE